MNQEILQCFSLRIKSVLGRLPPHVQQQVEEIRIRIERPIEIIVNNNSYFLTETGELTKHVNHGMLATPDDGKKILNLISRHSVYAIEEELRRGYITIPGGHRVGIAGRAVVENGRVRLLKDIASFNFRVAREWKGIALPILPLLINKQGRVANTLIISPPRCGKTTLLRDIARLLSSGLSELNIPGYKVGVVDERSEIAGCQDGLPQSDLGPRVDVLDACPKAEGMMMLIRSMSPDVILCDEIGSSQDTQAILEAIHAGVSIVTSAHALDVEDVCQRPNLHPLFTPPVFERYILLSNRQGAGTIEAILDSHRKPVGDLVC